MATSLTYQDTVELRDAAKTALKRAMARKVTSAHGRTRQAQEIDQLEQSLDKWDRKVTELDPDIDSSIQVAQVVPR